MELTTRNVYPSLEKWKGHIEIYDPIPMYLLIDFEKAISEIRASGDTKFLELPTRVKVISALFPLVKQWNFEGIPQHPTIDDFPDFGSKFARHDICNLLVWVVNVFIKTSKGEDPNE